MDKKRKRKIGLLLSFAAFFVCLIIAAPQLVYAAAGDTPAHSKSLTDNHDGTYKLELTVTGDADDMTENDSHVNVLLVYDESSSMTMYNAPDSNRSRADHTEDAVYGLMNGLVGYQNQGVDIYAAEVGFGTGSDQRSGWTNSLTTIRGHFDEGVDGQISNIHQYSNHNGTNWASALNRADGLLDGLTNVGGTDRSSYPTFVILITDGAPTAGGSGGTVMPGPDVPWTSYRNHYSAATEAAYSIQSRDNVTLYGIYAFGSDANLLDDLMYYSTHNAHRVVDGYSIMTAQQNQHNFGLTESGAEDYYYGAQSTQALLDIIEDIFNQIVEAMGITDVTVNDGTTNEVTLDSGEVVNLLGVDEDSYQYWLSIPLDENNQFKRTLNIDNQATEITYTVTDNGDGTCTISWREGTSNKSVTYDGSISGRQFKYEWTAADDFYDVAPPAAELVDGAVIWELGEDVGVLLSGVTYSVTFDVYPSQTALDYKAKLENGEAYNDVVPAEAQEYFKSDGSLETNTTATLTYSDMRLDNPGPKTETFDNPPRVETEAIQMDIEKEWKGAAAPDLGEKGLKVDVLADGDKEDPFYEATLNTPDWESQFNISCGIIKDGEPLEDAMGHDFSFAELGDEQYRWELHAPVVRPMIINGEDIEPTNEPTMLIKADPENGYDPAGKTTYTIDGATYYVDPSVTSLKATNYRRSNLNLTKVVTGDGAPADAKFPFTLTVNNIKAPETEPTDDPNHNSDYWVWFSIRDAENNFVTTEANVQNATQSGNYFYAKSGDEITLDMQAGWNLRFTNLPSGSTYTFEEGDTANFKFISAESTGAEDDTFEADGKTATGTIVTYNGQAYEVTYTNDYGLIDVTVNKKWNDNDDAYKQRPEDLTLTLNGAPQSTTVPTPVVQSDEDDDSIWTYTWSELPKYDDDGEEIEYTVSEENVPTGYKVSGSPAGNGETITNTLSAVAVDPPVKKVITPESAANRLYNNGDFTFTIANTSKPDGVETAPMPEKTEITNIAANERTDQKGYYEFGQIVFTEPGTYEYTVSEAGSVAGVTNDDDQTLTFEVTENEDGTLSVTPDSDSAVFEFTNKYDPEDATATLTVNKELKGEAQGTIDRTFKFELYKSNASGSQGDKVGETSITTENGTGSADFEGEDVEKALTFSEAGTYYFLVVETPEEVAGYTFDTSKYIVKIVVTENTEEGKLVAADPVFTKVKDGSESEATSIDFVNDFAFTSITVDLELTKTIEDLSNSDPDSTFTFDLYKDSVSDDNLIGTKSITTEDQTGSVKFTNEDVKDNALTFTKGGEYIFVVVEQNTGEDGYVYDETEHTYTVIVDENLESATLAVNSDSTLKAEITNQYQAEATSLALKVKKEVKDTSGSADKDMTFEFTLSGEDIDTQTQTIKDGETATFDAIEYTEVGTYTYTIKETAGDAKGYTYDTAEYEVTVKVTDDGGKLVAEATYKNVTTGEESTSLTITNTYDPEDASVILTAEKTVEGLAENASDQTFTFELLKDGNVVDTVARSGAGSITFKEQSFDKVGTYNYIVREKKGDAKGYTYDSTEYAVTIEVTDDKEGNLKAEVTGGEGIVFTNTYKAKPGDVVLKADKILTGRDLKVGEFTFLLKDAEGNVVSTAKNTVDGKIIFDKMTFDEAGDYEYTMVEVAGDEEGMTYDDNEYTVTVKVTDNGAGELIAKSNDKVSFTNEYVPPEEEEEEPPEEPDTGDSAMNGLVLALIALCASGTTLGFALRRREQE